MILKNLLTEGEAIYAIIRIQGFPINIIGPQTENPERELDISGCLEDTLHRLLKAGATDDEIMEILAAEKRDYCNLDDQNNQVDEDDYNYDIDLGYTIFSFYPTATIPTGIVYERPTNIFVAMSVLQIPDDPTDDEVLDVARQALGIDPDQFVVKEVEKGYVLQSLVDESHNVVLMHQM